MEKNELQLYIDLEIRLDSAYSLVPGMENYSVKDRDKARYTEAKKIEDELKMSMTSPTKNISQIMRNNQTLEALNSLGYNPFKKKKGLLTHLADFCEIVARSRL